MMEILTYAYGYALAGAHISTTSILLNTKYIMNLSLLVVFFFSLFFLVSSSPSPSSCVSIDNFSSSLISSCSSSPWSNRCVFVDASQGSDSAGDGSAASPLASIARAVTMSRAIADNNTRIALLVQDGAYPGGFQFPSWLGSNTFVFSSVNGPNCTIIDCLLGPSTDFSQPRIGTAISINSDVLGPGNGVRGFTLQNCRASEGAAISIEGTEKTQVAIDQCVIRKNSADLGAGVFIKSASPTITNCIIMNNEAQAGAAVFVVASRNFTLIDSFIVGNSAVTGIAAGLQAISSVVLIVNTTFDRNLADFGSALMVDSCAVRISNSSFTGNQAALDDGGAMIAYRSEVFIQRTSFINNYCFGEGGAIKFKYPYARSPLDYSYSNSSQRLQYHARTAVQVSIVDCVFQGNRAAGKSGALSFKDSVTSSIANSSFIMNSALDSGSAILISGINAATSIDNCSFVGNRGIEGALAVQGANPVTISRCLFADNIQSSNGGGISIGKNKAMVTITDSAIVNNTAPIGAGMALYGGSSVTAVRTAFIGNSIPQSAAVQLSGRGPGCGGGLSVVELSKCKLTSCSFISNRSPGYGSGIFALSIPSASIVLNSVQFTNNSAGEGGALYFSSNNPVSDPAIDVSTVAFNGNAARFAPDVASLPVRMAVSLTALTAGATPSFVISNGSTSLMAAPNFAIFTVAIQVVDYYGQSIQSSDFAADLYVSVNKLSPLTTSPGASTYVNPEHVAIPHSGSATFDISFAAASLGQQYEIDFVIPALAAVPRVAFAVAIPQCLPMPIEIIRYRQAGLYDFPLCSPASVEAVTAGQFGAIVGIFSLVLFAFVGLLVSTFLFSSHVVYKASAVVLLRVILIGSMALFIGAFLMLATLASSNINEASSYCRAQFLLLGVGFVLVFGGLATKNYRIRTIFANSRLVSVKRGIKKDWTLLLIVLVLIVIELGLRGLWTGLSNVRADYFIQGDAAAVSLTCTADSSSSALLVVSLLYNGLILAATCVLAYEIRHAPANFNESRQLLFATYNFAVVLVVLLAVQFLDIHAIMKYSIFAVGILITTSITIMALFIPKLYTIFVSRHSSTVHDANLNGVDSVLHKVDHDGTSPASYIVKERGQSQMISRPRPSAAIKRAPGSPLCTADSSSIE